MSWYDSCISVKEHKFDVRTKVLELLLEYIGKNGFKIVLQNLFRYLFSTIQPWGLLRSSTNLQSLPESAFFFKCLFSVLTTSAFSPSYAKLNSFTRLHENVVGVV